MKPLSLKEFRAVSLISDSALIWLLERKALPIILDPNHGIMVDMKAVDTQKLLQALAREKETLDSTEFNLLAEQAGKIIRDNIDTIIEEAIGRLNQR